MIQGLRGRLARTAAGWCHNKRWLTMPGVAMLRPERRRLQGRCGLQRRVTQASSLASTTRGGRTVRQCPGGQHFALLSSRALAPWCVFLTFYLKKSCAVFSVGGWSHTKTSCHSQPHTHMLSSPQYIAHTKCTHHHITKCTHHRPMRSSHSSAHPVRIPRSDRSCPVLLLQLRLFLIPVILLLLLLLLLTAPHC